jgi:hypothetical protein
VRWMADRRAFLRARRNDNAGPVEEVQPLNWARETECRAASGGVGQASFSRRLN